MSVYEVLNLFPRWPLVFPSSLIPLFVARDLLTPIFLPSSYWDFDYRPAGKFLLLFWTNLSFQMQFYQSLELFIKVTNDLVAFPEEDNALLWGYKCWQSCPLRHWNTATVDQILIEGDRMYLNALESENIPDAGKLSLIYEPNQARWKAQSPTEVPKSPAEANNSTQSPFEANITCSVIRELSICWLIMWQIKYKQDNFDEMLKQLELTSKQFTMACAFRCSDILIISNFKYVI